MAIRVDGTYDDPIWIIFEVIPWGADPIWQPRGYPCTSCKKWAWHYICPDEIGRLTDEYNDAV